MHFEVLPEQQKHHVVPFSKSAFLKWLKLGLFLSKMQICSFPYFLNLTVRNLSRRNDSSDTTADEQACSKNWLGSTMLLVVARHHACSRRNAFTWADNLIIMLMQFYSEFHKVSKGYRPIHGLHKQVYKARQTARFRLLSVTGQQQQCRSKSPQCILPSPVALHHSLHNLHLKHLLCSHGYLFWPLYKTQKAFRQYRDKTNGWTVG